MKHQKWLTEKTVQIKHKQQNNNNDNNNKYTQFTTTRFTIKSLPPWLRRSRMASLSSCEVHAGITEVPPPFPTHSPSILLPCPTPSHSPPVPFPFPLSPFHFPLSPFPALPWNEPHLISTTYNPPNSILFSNIFSRDNFMYSMNYVTFFKICHHKYHHDHMYRMCAMWCRCIHSLVNNVSSYSYVI